MALKENALECEESSWRPVDKTRRTLVVGIAGTIIQHGKITISLGSGNVATLKGGLNETGTDITGIVCTTDPLSFDGGQQLYG